MPSRRPWRSPIGEPELPDGSLFGRAVDSAASLAGAIFTDLPFSGEVNLLTTGAFGPGALFTGDGFPRGVAYLAIGAPTPAGDWSVRAAMSQGDLSSWIVAGAFASKPGSSHAYKFGLSYSTQEYLGGNPAALAAMTDGSRNVGEIYGFDRWPLGSKVAVEYGGRYARYDYLQEGGLLSPRVGVTVEPFRDTRIKATVAQRMIAPGAEEFSPMVFRARGSRPSARSRRSADRAIPTRSASSARVPSISSWSMSSTRRSSSACGVSIRLSTISS